MGWTSTPALDDQSALIASLGGHRSARMRDVLGTIQADQDAIIRAGSCGAPVVDGGPGTGRTVVAMHRSAYSSTPRGAAAAIETDPDVARLKSTADMVKAIEPAIRVYEEPTGEGMTVETHWSDVWLSADDWADVFRTQNQVHRTTRRAARSGTSWSRSSSQARRRRRLA